MHGGISHHPSLIDKILQLNSEVLHRSRTRSILHQYPILVWAPHRKTPSHQILPARSRRSTPGDKIQRDRERWAWPLLPAQTLSKYGVYPVNKFVSSLKENICDTDFAYVRLEKHTIPDGDKKVTGELPEKPVK